MGRTKTSLNSGVVVISNSRNTEKFTVLNTVFTLSIGTH